MAAPAYAGRATMRWVSNHIPTVPERATETWANIEDNRMSKPEIDWGAVAQHMKEDSDQIRERAQGGFPNDMDTQREMRSRAAILESIAKAIWYGLG